MTAAKKNRVKVSPDSKAPVKKVSGKTKTGVTTKKVSAKTVKRSLKKTPQASHPPSQKATPHAKPVKKATVAGTASKKDPNKKIVNKAPAQAPKATQKAVTKATVVPEKKNRFQKSDLDQFKAELLSMRDRITGQSGSMRSAALQRTDETNPEEDGTDAFMRLQTLEQVSTQHQLIANIDAALRSIEKGAYGVCDTCGELISKPRLAVLPFATNCIKCQSEKERSPQSRNRR